MQLKGRQKTNNSKCAESLGYINHVLALASLPAALQKILHGMIWGIPDNHSGNCRHLSVFRPPCKSNQERGNYQEYVSIEPPIFFIFLSKEIFCLISFISSVFLADQKRCRKNNREGFARFLFKLESTADRDYSETSKI